MDGRALIEAYEAVAAEFYAETGICAPGKDIPAAVGGGAKTDPMYRQGAWDVWNMLKDKGDSNA